jgi:D-xylose transport system substrate-binding protein
VRRGIEETFELFARHMTAWWPLEGGGVGGAAAPLELHLEPIEGGRFYERDLSGAEHQIGTVLLWDPPFALKFTWRPDDFGWLTEIAVRFASEDKNLTRIELEHRAWERLGALKRVTTPTAFALLATGSARGDSSYAARQSSSVSSLKIAFVMPGSTCASRFEDQDKPDFIKAVHALNPAVHVMAFNAQGSDAMQVAQVERALAQGAKVIVVSPLDEATGVSIVSKASDVGVPVIAYDGLLTGAEICFYVSFDNTLVGKLQGQYLLDHLRPGSTIVMINGDQTSQTGIDFKRGALQALGPAFRSGRLKLGYSADTHQFEPAMARSEMERALAKLNNNVQGVLSSNDGIAGGVIAALRAQNLAGRVLVTGQDATTTGLKDIRQGAQSMTVFKPIDDEASIAARVAVGLVEGDRGVVAKVAKTKVNNSYMQVPSVLLKPRVVTKPPEPVSI